MSEPLPLPPLNDPRARLTWALRTLDVFSLPKNKHALGAKELRAAARRVILQVLNEHPNLRWQPGLRKHGPLWNHLNQERQEHLKASQPLQKLDPEKLLRALNL